MASRSRPLKYTAANNDKATRGNAPTSTNFTRYRTASSFYIRGTAPARFTPRQLRILCDRGRLRNLKEINSCPPCIFLLTFIANNFIYESHCDFRIAKFDVRENQSM